MVDNIKGPLLLHPNDVVRQPIIQGSCFQWAAQSDLSCIDVEAGFTFKHSLFVQIALMVTSS